MYTKHKKFFTDELLSWKKEIIKSNNLGNILQQTGKMEEATASYAKAIYLKPGFAEAHLNLSTTLSYMIIYFLR